MQTNEEVSQKILDILQPFVPDGLIITTETDLLTDLGLDSLKVMKILEQLEESFDISIPINILPDVRTIKDLELQVQKLNENGC
jgi:acyl carrier protein